MAKRKKSSSIKKKVSRFAPTKKTRTKRRSSSSLSPLKSYAGGFGYGLFRGKTANFVTNTIAPKIPFGNYSDEVAFTGISYLMARYGKKVLGVDMKKLGRDGLIVEGALMGAQTSDMLPDITSFGNVFAPKVESKKSIGYNS